MDATNETTKKKCRLCNGTGKVPTVVKSGATTKEVLADCPGCGGTGKSAGYRPK